MLVGSAGNGLFLVLSEAAKSDYVASRPFRVNAGPVHSYCLCPGGRTRYCQVRDSDNSIASCPALVARRHCGCRWPCHDLTAADTSNDVWARRGSLPGSRCEAQARRAAAWQKPPPAAARRASLLLANTNRFNDDAQTHELPRAARTHAQCGKSASAAWDAARRRPAAGRDAPARVGLRIPSHEQRGDGHLLELRAVGVGVCGVGVCEVRVCGLVSWKLCPAGTCRSCGPVARCWRCRRRRAPRGP
jgi:hypothetical protein